MLLKIDVVNPIDDSITTRILNTDYLMYAHASPDSDDHTYLSIYDETDFWIANESMNAFTERLLSALRSNTHEHARVWAGYSGIDALTRELRLHK